MGKVTIGLELHWPCAITDVELYPPPGLKKLWQGDGHPSYGPTGPWHRSPYITLVWKWMRVGTFHIQNSFYTILSNFSFRVLTLSDRQKESNRACKEYMGRLWSVNMTTDIDDKIISTVPLKPQNYVWYQLARIFRENGNGKTVIDWLIDWGVMALWAQ